MSYTNVPRVAGLDNRSEWSIPEWTKKRRSLVNPHRIERKDRRDCLAAALVGAKYHVDSTRFVASSNHEVENDEYSPFPPPPPPGSSPPEPTPMMKEGNGSVRSVHAFVRTVEARRLAELLTVEAGLPTNSALHLDDIRVLMDTITMKGYGLVVWSETSYPEPYLKIRAEGKEEGRCLHLFYLEKESHCYIVVSPSGFFGTKHFCGVCFKGHNCQSASKHLCAQSQCQLVFLFNFFNFIF